MDQTQLLEKFRKLVQEDTRKIVQVETLEIVQRETRKIVQEETRKIVQEETRKIVQEEMAPLKKDVKKIRKDLEFAVGELDMNSNTLEKRVKRIEFHLGLSS